MSLNSWDKCHCMHIFKKVLALGKGSEINQDLLGCCRCLISQNLFVIPCPYRSYIPERLV